MVAGAISIMTLGFNAFGTKNILGDELAETNASYVTGSFWMAITICSLFGLIHPYKFSPVLIIQIIYKGIFLLRKFLPDLISGKINLERNNTIGMSIFFLFGLFYFLFSYHGTTCSESINHLPMKKIYKKINKHF